MSTVGLALIVRDEEESLPGLLASIDGAFDQVVLVDTGSEDRTIEVFREWAEGQHPMPFTVAGMAWGDDFAAARSYADSLLQTDWTCWADADDEIRGAAQLRGIAASAPAHVLAVIAGYEYAHDEHGNCVCHLKRERLVRRGAGSWTGRVHEAQLILGAQMELSAGLVQWVHRKSIDAAASNERNLRILRSWVEDEPENPRVLGYLGTEELIHGDAAAAAGFFRRYLKLRTGWDEERAQIHRKLSIAEAHQGNHEASIAAALEAVQLLPSWPDSYLSLAEAYYGLGEWAKAAEWARDVLRRGQPDSMLILNPLDYSLFPRVILAASLGNLGRIDEALEVAEQALAIAPSHEELRRGYLTWTAARKRESTARTVIALAQQLVAHDEQLQALALLEQAVPHYVLDHADVVAARSELRERVAQLVEPDAYREHYEVGGSKPEDFIPDDQVDELAGSLPRARFLLDGLLEQVGASA